MSSIQYTLMLRDLVHTQQPNHGFQEAADVRLDDSQVATIVREYPDVVAEAIAGHEPTIANILDGAHALKAMGKEEATGFVLFQLLRFKAAAYILTDLACMADEMDQEERVDNEFEAHA